MSSLDEPEDMQHKHNHPDTKGAPIAQGNTPHTVFLRMQDNDSCLAFRCNRQAWSRGQQNIQISAEAEPECRRIPFMCKPVATTNETTAIMESLDLMIMRAALDAPTFSLS
jgi:hypothetical protein